MENPLARAGGFKHDIGVSGDPGRRTRSQERVDLSKRWDYMQLMQSRTRSQERVDLSGKGGTKVQGVLEPARKSGWI